MARTGRYESSDLLCSETQRLLFALSVQRLISSQLNALPLDGVFFLTFVIFTPKPWANDPI